jgi:hypothetical protein
MAQLIVVGASYHRAGMVRDAAEALNIDLVPLPGYIHAGRGALALASGGCHLSYQRRVKASADGFLDKSWPPMELG